MKHLAATGTIEETGHDEYRPNGFSTALTVESYSDSIPLMSVMDLHIEVAVTHVNLQQDTSFHQGHHGSSRVPEEDQLSEPHKPY